MISNIRSISLRHVFAGLAAAALAATATPAGAGSVTYTTSAEFDGGAYSGVNSTVVADQLQLNVTGTTFHNMWIANAGEDTVSKVDTNAASTAIPSGGCEVARYRTHFGPLGHQPHNAYAYAAPSRTAVDIDGNMYVANRWFDQDHPAEVMKVLAEGGIDRNGNGVIDTSADTNGDCIIGAGEILPLVDTNGNGIVDPGEIQDERVVWHVRVGGNYGLGRSLCIGTDGNLWLGLYNHHEYYKLSSVDGSVLSGPISTPGVNPYGCVVDQYGMLYSASLSSVLGILDTAAPPAFVTTKSAPASFYGITAGNGKVYMGTLNSMGPTVYDPPTDTFSNPAVVPYRNFSTSVTVDGNGDIFHGQSPIIKYQPDGTYILSASTAHSAYGLVVDGNNDVWGISLASSNISKFDGATGNLLGIIPIGASPYTYSDATGFAVRNVTSPTGTWTIIRDSGFVGGLWTSVSWTESAPAGASVLVEVRVASSVPGLGSATYQAVTSGGAVAAAGQFLEARVRLNANTAGDTPVVSDVTIDSTSANSPPVADAGGPYTVGEGSSVTLDASGSTDPDGDAMTFAWDFDGDGVYDDATGETPTFSAASLDNGIYTIAVQVTDSSGAFDTATATVTVNNVAPTVAAGGDQTVGEGDTVTIAATFSDPAAGDTHTVSVDWGDGSAPGSSLNDTHVYPDDGTYTVTVTVTDDDGGVGTDTLTVTVTNVAPAVAAGGDQTVGEGDTVTIAASFSDQGAGDTHTVSVDWGDGSTPGTSLNDSHVYPDDGTYTVTVTVTDDDGGVGTDTLIVTVTDTVPVITSFTTTIDPVAVNTTVIADGTYECASVDVCTAEIDWGDGTTSSPTAGGGSVSGTHDYTVPGIYTVALTITDDDGSSDTMTYEYVVVYDPSGSFVTGGGHINVPAGSYAADTSLTGRGSFGLVSKYQKGKTTPQGNTQFQFHAAGMNFHSTSYEWLVVAGAQAKYKGAGSINNAGNFGFQVFVTDGDLLGAGADKFRIKIWDKSNGDAVVFDNETGEAIDADPTTFLTGGSIVIHEKKGS